MRSRITIFILGLALLATMAITGCSLFGDDDDDDVYTPGTTIKGSISATADGVSLRQGLRAAAATSATISFNYLDGNGNPVTLVTGIPAIFAADGKAPYEFNVILPEAALLKRNFILSAILDNAEKIEGVVPFDPTAEKTVEVPVIDPDDAGPVAFVKAATIAGIPNVGMGDVLSIYTTGDLMDMIDPVTHLPKADMTTLVTQFKAREEAIQTTINGEFAAQAALIKQLMDYSFQLARDPQYMGFANREKYLAAMKIKAAELGLPADAFNAIDEATTDVWVNLPPPPVTLPENFTNYGGAQEQNREMERLGLALQYFAGLLTDKTTEINTIREEFLNKANTFFGQAMAGNPPAMTADGHPFFTLDKARLIIFEALGNDAVNIIKINPATDLPTQPPASFADFLKLMAGVYAKVAARIEDNYASFTGEPTDATEKAKFIQALATLASIPMAPAGGNNNGGETGTDGGTWTGSWSNAAPWVWTGTWAVNAEIWAGTWTWDTEVATWKWFGTWAVEGSAPQGPPTVPSMANRPTGAPGANAPEWPL